MINGKCLWLTIALILLAISNVLWGSLDIPVKDVWRIICGNEVSGHPAWRIIVLQGRVPQMLTALFTGAALGTCGLLLQTAFRNPLAGPSILGIDSGANLGVAIVQGIDHVVTHLRVQKIGEHKGKSALQSLDNTL